MNKEEKAKLWSDRIQQCQTSGKTCKQWCAENDIPLSTMGYWIQLSEMRGHETSGKRTFPDPCVYYG